MNHSTVHMRDQKANQSAMLSRSARQTMINMVEEITLVLVLWGVFLIASHA